MKAEGRLSNVAHLYKYRITGYHIFKKAAHWYRKTGKKGDIFASFVLFKSGCEGVK